MCLLFITVFIRRYRHNVNAHIWRYLESTIMKIVVLVTLVWWLNVIPMAMGSPLKKHINTDTWKSSVRTKLFRYFPSDYRSISAISGSESGSGPGSGPGSGSGSDSGSGLFSLVPRELVLVSLLQHLGLKDYFFFNGSISSIIPKNIHNVFLLKRKSSSSHLFHYWQNLASFANSMMPFGVPSLARVVEMGLVVPTVSIRNQTGLKEQTLAINRASPLHETAVTAGTPVLVTMLESDSHSANSGHSLPFFDLFAKAMIENGNYDALAKAIFCEFPFFCVEIPDSKHIRMSSPWSTSNTTTSKVGGVSDSWRLFKTWIRNNVLESFEKNGLFLPLTLIQEQLHDGIPRTRKFSQIIFNGLAKAATYPLSSALAKNPNPSSKRSLSMFTTDDHNCIPITWYNIFHHSIFGDTKFCSTSIATP